MQLLGEADDQQKAGIVCVKRYTPEDPTQIAPKPALKSQNIPKIVKNWENVPETTRCSKVGSTFEEGV
jgi:hypothetical protein